MKSLLAKIPKFLFFTGKGGVGKTSMSCAIAVALAKEGKKVLLISTDPASNLDEVLQSKLNSTPTPVNGLDSLYAMNINPVIAAHEYKEKMVAPYRGVLPQSAIEQMEEQLSGACTVEIAGFNEFSKYVGDEEIITQYEHVILDTAPTGHTLRLLSLPSAWNDFIADNSTGSSCLGPVSGLSAYKKLYDSVVENLKDASQTLLILVARAEKLSLIEAANASKELALQGMQNQHLVINGIFNQESDDHIAHAFYTKSCEAIKSLPSSLQGIEKTEVGFYPQGVVGLDSLTQVTQNSSVKEFDNAKADLDKALETVSKNTLSFETLVQELSCQKNGLIMTMGKGGVGKTTMASLIALQLAQKGHEVVLSTTDPAAHLEYIWQDNDLISVEKIDPKVEKERHVNRVIAQNEGKLNEADMDLLKEELSSPCIEEIAIFEAFAKTVEKAKDKFVVLDTAPTGHTLLLLDTSNAYHKEVMKNNNSSENEALINLLPALKDKNFTKIVLSTLAEATPTHEAKDLQEDLKRAGIEPYAWIINRSFAVTNSTHNLICQKGLNEIEYIKEIQNELSSKTVICPWVAQEINSAKSLEKLL